MPTRYDKMNHQLIVPIQEPYVAESDPVQLVLNTVTVAGARFELAICWL